MPLCGIQVLTLESSLVILVVLTVVISDLVVLSAWSVLLMICLFHSIKVLHLNSIIQTLITRTSFMVFSRLKDWFVSRFSPDGAFFASVGSDRTINVFDGKVGR